MYERHFGPLGLDLGPWLGEAGPLTPQREVNTEGGGHTVKYSNSTHTVPDQRPFSFSLVRSGLCSLPRLLLIGKTPPAVTGLRTKYGDEKLTSQNTIPRVKRHYIGYPFSLSFFLFFSFLPPHFVPHLKVSAECRFAWCAHTLSMK
jgi:hypothetical protein